MQVSVTKPTFEYEFKVKIAKAKAKKVHSQITEVEDRAYISVYSQNRPVGRFTFIKEDTIATIEKSHVIERDYYPLEFCISELVKYYKRKKIKYIDW